LRALTRADVEAAVLGGALLGGGGGGWLADGRKLGELAVSMGRPLLASIEELPAGALVFTVSLVGAPAAAERYIEPIDHLRAVELAVEAVGCRPAALIANENGATATVNGWLQSACLGLPVLDAPCNGRAHPTGTMGAMGLHRRAEYVSTQGAVGGDGRRERHVELAVRAPLPLADALVRQAAVQAGGLVAVARNPVEVGYLKEHAAPGAISQAITVGELLLASAPGERAEAAARLLGGELVAQGEVVSHQLETRGGFDVGRVEVASDRGPFRLSIWNEYMTLDGREGRLATFPDLIATLGPDGLPLISAEIEVGVRLCLLVVPADRLVLGAGMRDQELFRVVEETIGEPVLAHAFPRQGSTSSDDQGGTRSDELPGDVHD